MEADEEGHVDHHLEDHHGEKVKETESENTSAKDNTAEDDNEDARHEEEYDAEERALSAMSLLSHDSDDDPTWAPSISKRAKLEANSFGGKPTKRTMMMGGGDLNRKHFAEKGYSSKPNEAEVSLPYNNIA